MLTQKHNNLAVASISRASCLHRAVRAWHCMRLHITQWR